jgi:DHA3 family macrolide efflux protein-like MFS transporter
MNGRSERINGKRQITGGTKAFLLICFGQLISLIGSGLTGFALGVWVYQQTGAVTQFALITLFTTLPGIVVSPVAGAIVDRWNRRHAMMLSDSVAGCCALVVALLLLSGRLDIWHIYLAMGVSSAFVALHWPAYAAAVTMLFPRRHLGRASGLMQLGQATAKVISPMLAGALVGTIHIHGVLLLDFATFLFAFSTLLFVRMPTVASLPETEEKKGSLLGETLYGWTYITRRPGLFLLLALFAANNFLTGIVIVLVTPLILSFASAAVLGAVLTVAGGGMLAGGAIMSIWGGPRRRVRGILIFTILQSALLVTGGLRASVTLIAAAAFGYLFAASVISGASQSLWQSKIAPSVQGRVFAVRSLIAWSSLPLASLAAGPLSDSLFEPLLAVNGPLAESVGRIIGVGPGRGIGLLFILAGFVTLLTTSLAYLHPRLRFVEDELPDAMAEDSLERFSATASVPDGSPGSHAQ